MDPHDRLPLLRPRWVKTASTTPEAAVAAAVLHQAVHDVRHPEKADDYKSARRFLFDKSAESKLRFWCEIVDLNIEAIRERLGAERGSTGCETY